MPSIRDLVGAIRQREGVEAAVVLGRDGLLIDSQAVPGLDAEDVAARIPAIIGPADELGAPPIAASCSPPCSSTADGLAIVSVLSPDAILLVLVRPQREHRPTALRAAPQSRAHRRPRLSIVRTSNVRPTCHVLVADDEPHIGRIIKMKLEQGPFRVTLAYDGREALEVLERETDIGLVLLDLMMPHLSGLDVLAEMQRDDRLAAICRASSSPRPARSSSTPARWSWARASS